MKNIFTLTLLLLSSILFSQVPQGISYQAIALNSSGNPVANATVTTRLSVLNLTATGAVLYAETHSKTTNAQGLYNLVIGQGSVVSGVFNTINWGNSAKFLKVELDINGGSNYALVGTTQLLTVPYAFTASQLVTLPGQGITLVSPNGTPFQVAVNNNGELSLPTSNNSSTTPTQLYLYGTFNNYNAATAIQFGNFFSEFLGYKYFTAGTQFKFLGAQNESVVYGVSNNSNFGQLVLNGPAYTIPSTGFYKITLNQSNYFEINSINVELNQNYTVNTTMQYNTAQNYFFATSNYGEIKFKVAGLDYGDNLADGTIEYDGATIISNQGTNYQYRLFLNFNGSGNYTKIQQ